MANQQDLLLEPENRSGYILLDTDFWIWCKYATITCQIASCYKTASASSLVPSAFHDRFIPALVTFLKAALSHALSHHIAEPTRAMDEKFKGFSDLVATDGTVLRSRMKNLQCNGLACRPNHTKATIKIHVVTSALTAAPRHVALFSSVLQK